jgi:hypothetical protein
LLLQDLIRRAGLKKKSLKMTALLWSNEPKPLALATDSLFRIVSEPLLSKNGRIRLLGCGPAGRLSLALKPSAATPANQIFLQVRRGDLIRVSNAVPREGGLTLTPESRVELVRRAHSA